MSAGALVTAGIVNTVLAPADARFVLFRGTFAADGTRAERADWIASHAGRWQAGWSFWFVVTLTFFTSFFVLARYLRGSRELRSLAVAAAALAAAVDLVGIVVQLVLTTHLATAEQVPIGVYGAAEHLGHALTDVTAFGLYSLAGLLLIPAAFATDAYPRVLAWLGLVEWGSSAIATGFLALDLPGKGSLLLLGFALYGPWVWGSAFWLLRKERVVAGATVPRT